MGHRSLPGAAVRCVSQCQVIFSITVLGGYGAAPAAVAALARREAAGSAASSKKAHRAKTAKCTTRHKAKTNKEARQTSLSGLYVQVERLQESLRDCLETR